MPFNVLSPRPRRLRAALLGCAALTVAIVGIGAISIGATGAHASGNGSVTATKYRDSRNNPGFDLTTKKGYFTIEVDSSSSSQQTVVVTDVGATLESVEPSGACTGSGPWTCIVPARGPNENYAITYLHVSQPLPSDVCTVGHVDDTAYVTWNGSAIGDRPADSSHPTPYVWARNDVSCAPSVTPQPNILISKSAGTPVLPAGGGPETYTYTVTNPGNVPLSDVSVSDNTCSPVTFVGGDTNTNNLLDTSETWTFTCTMNITANTTNIATATGTADGTTVSAQAQASVTVQTAQTVVQTLTVTKVVSPASDPGTFNLLIDGTTEASSVGNGGATGPVQVTAGPHTVSETGANGTNLSNYTTTFSANCAGGSVNVAAGTAVVCTITNTRNTTETSNPPPNNPPITLITIPQQPAPTPTATPTARPTEAPQPTATAEPTKTSAVLGEKTPGPGATPAPPSAGSGRYSNWFHSAGALSVIGLFILSAALSGMVLFTTRKRGE